MPAYVNAKKKILQCIRNQNLTAGDRLPTGTELSERPQIGRLALREALNTTKKLPDRIRQFFVDRAQS